MRPLLLARRGALSESIPISPPGEPDWQPKLIITTGGIYDGANYGYYHECTETGNYLGAVEVRTSQPVTIQNMNLRNLVGGLSHCIWAQNGAQVTVRHVTGETRLSWHSGRFFSGGDVTTVDIQNCTLNGTRGIYIGQGNNPTSGYVKILYNRHNEITGGWYNHYGEVGNFVQLAVCKIPSIEIGWNEVVTTPQPNHPSAADNWFMHEDVVSIYHTQNVHFHNNMLWHSSFPGNLDGSGQPNQQYSTQGGITLDSSVAGPGVSNCLIENNQVVDGYGIFAGLQYGGINNRFMNNRIVQDGYLPDGRKTENGWAGIGFTATNYSPSGNHAEGNYLAYVNRDGTRKDYSDNFYPEEGAAAEKLKNTSPPNPITAAMEQAEWTLWQQKLVANSITLGA